MRNRTWMAVVAGLAVVVVGFQFLAAKSQLRNAKAAEPAAAAAAKRDIQHVDGHEAVAVVHALGDHKVKGKVTFTQKDDGVEIVAELTGLTPGEHGFHVHEFGDCSMADGKCAGGHFNPTGTPTAAPTTPNATSATWATSKPMTSAKPSYKRVDKLIALHGPNSVIGRSVILHAKADDMKTQPTGDAGDRIGCGTIGIADPKMQMAN